MTTIWYGDGPNSPRTSPASALALAGLPADRSCRVVLGWTIERHPWISDPGLHISTVLAGYGLARPVAEARVTPLPIRLSAVPSLIETEPPDLAVVTGVRRGDGFAFAGAVGWADVLARTAARVVVEVDDDVADLGAPGIDGNVVATIPRPAPPDDRPAASRPADDVDLEIGTLVTSILPDEPTLQFGPGGIGEGIARSLDRPVRIWSGLVTDAIAGLHPRGLLVEPAVAAYTWGGAPVTELAEAGMLDLRSCTVTHDLTHLSAIPRFVACNTALQVGLDGAVNLERVGGRVIAAVGGHSDFCVGASRSVGGCSIVAVRSTAVDGSSTIVPSVEVVSTQRSDVDVVVTEHGIADLRGVDDATRSRRLVAVAAPEHRIALACGLP